MNRSVAYPRIGGEDGVYNSLFNAKRFSCVRSHWLTTSCKKGKAAGDEDLRDGMLRPLEPVHVSNAPTASIRVIRPRGAGTDQSNMNQYRIPQDAHVPWPGRSRSRNNYPLSCSIKLLGIIHSVGILTGRIC